MSNKYYENAALWAVADPSHGYEALRCRTATELIPPGAATLLDVGCGNAQFISVAEKARPELRYLGIERSNVAIAGRLCQSEVVSGDLDTLPFPDRSFDMVVTMAVLEHLPHRLADTLVAEIMRCSRGYILLNLPYREWRARIRCPQCGCRFNPHLHLRSYGDREIAALFPGFTEKRRVVLKGDEAIIPFIATRVLRLELDARRMPFSVCPQCGEGGATPSDASAATAAPQRAGLLRSLWRAQPKLRVAREIFVLFERTT